MDNDNSHMKMSICIIDATSQLAGLDEIRPADYARCFAARSLHVRCCRILAQASASLASSHSRGILPVARALPSWARAAILCCRPTQ